MFFHGPCPSPPPPPDTTRELAIASLGALIGALLTLILVVALKPRTSSPAEAAALTASPSSPAKGCLLHESTNDVLSERAWFCSVWSASN